MRRNSPWICTMAVTAAFVATAAGDPTIDASKSSIIATFRQEKVPVDAPLKKFNGRIDYNAAQPNAAKAALENYTMSAAFELASMGVTANVVHPPVTDTGWVTDAVRQAVLDDPQLLHVDSPKRWRR